MIWTTSRRFTLRVALGYPDLTHEVELIYSQNQQHPFDELQPVLSCDEMLKLQEEIKSVHCERAVVEYMVRLCEWTRGEPRFSDTTVQLFYRSLPPVLGFQALVGAQVIAPTSPEPGSPGGPCRSASTFEVSRSTNSSWTTSST